MSNDEPEILPAESTARCKMCGEPAVWQIGTDIPYQSRARFYCAAHAPRLVVEAWERQEAERREAEARQ